MYLSRLVLNPRSRQAQSELANPYEMHRTIMSAFPDELPPGERVLFRLEGAPRSGQLILLVQSQTAPDWSKLTSPAKSYLLRDERLLQGAPNPAVKQVELRQMLKEGQRLAFRLRANPTAKRTFEKDGVKTKKRIGLYREEDQLRWLERKLAEAGCKLLEARASGQEMQQGELRRDAERHRLEYLGVVFDGMLLVEDPQRLAQAVDEGIGSGKGLGFGLLSLAPWHE